MIIALILVFTGAALFWHASNKPVGFSAMFHGAAALLMWVLAAIVATQ
jgi:hypothetical protein